MKQVLLTLFLLVFTINLKAETIQVTFEVPTINASPYHRPYLAIWLENESRTGVESLAVWHEDSKWLNDMRQWWRKLGNRSNVDAVTGATKPPGKHRITWDSSALPAGNYYLCIETAREEGGREYLREIIILGNKKPLHYALQGEFEIGRIDIQIDP